MVNYDNSKIYKIWSTAGDKIYIGSTTKKYLSQRMDNHRSGYKLWKNDKHYLTTSYHLFEEYGLDNCFIELLEAKVCNSKDELKQLEGKYIRSMVCVNKCIAGRTRREYLEDNKDKIKEQHKAYYEENKIMIIEQKKKYQEDNIDKIKKYREDNKEKYKQYCEDNKDKIKEQHKQYHEKNKDTIRAKLSEQCECECGNKYTHGNRVRHLKSIRHCQFIDSLQ